MVTDDWGFTTPYVHKVNYTWTINDWMKAFHFLENHTLVSPRISPPTEPRFIFQVILYMKNAVFPDYLVAKVYVKAPVDFYHFSIMFTLYDKTCQAIMNSSPKRDLNSEMFKIIERKWLNDNANRYLTSSGQMPMVISIKINHTAHSYGGECKKLAVNETSKVCHLGKYKANDAYADGSIVPKDDNEIPVHKVVMAAKSTVLAEAYLEDDTFQADDIDRETMNEVLDYIYCDKLDDMTKLAVKLLAAANSLKIDGLKMLCESELCGRINATNVYEIYAVASKYKAENLRKKAAEYIASNQAEVMKSDSFREISQQHPVCVSDLMSIK